jgi:hypothetical protein
MRNRALHRRLAAIETEFDRLAKAMERERIAARRISPEDAERTYRKLIDSCSKRARSEESRKPTPHQAAAQYFELVRGTTLPQAHTSPGRQQRRT